MQNSTLDQNNLKLEPFHLRSCKGFCTFAVQTTRPLNPEAIPSFKVPAYLRFVARNLSRLNTHWASKFALSLFFKPLPFGIPEREKPFREKATKHELLTKNAQEFLVFELKASGPKVVMIHGWSGRASQFFKIAEFLHQHNFHVFCIEAPHHGELQGGRTHMLDFVDSIEETCHRFGPFEIAIGHSLGGMALFNVLSRNIWFEKLVTIGSPANIQGVVNDFTEKLELNEAVASNILKYIEHRYQITTAQASSDQLCQVFRPEGLIVHDRFDQDVDVSNARHMHKKWRGSRYLETEGLGHRQVLRDDKVLDAIYDFFKN